MGSSASKKNQKSASTTKNENGAAKKEDVNAPAEDSSQDHKVQNGVANNTKELASEKVKEQSIEPVQLNQSVIDEYINLEKDIYLLEKKNVTRKFEDKILHAEELKKTIDQLEATCKELKKQTDKEKADVDNIEQPSVRAFLKQQGTYERKFSAMQKCHLDALNRQEIAERELLMERAQYAKALKAVEYHKQRAEKLIELYDKQDKLLSSIFGGKYGSDLEKQLENELDEAFDWQQRVALAKFKWSNARVLLVNACTQMAFGVKRWKEIAGIDKA